MCCCGKNWPTLPATAAIYRGWAYDTAANAFLNYFNIVPPAPPMGYTTWDSAHKSFYAIAGTPSGGPANLGIIDMLTGGQHTIVVDSGASYLSPNASSARAKFSPVRNATVGAYNHIPGVVSQSGTAISMRVASYDYLDSYYTDYSFDSGVKPVFTAGVLGDGSPVVRYGRTIQGISGGSYTHGSGADYSTNDYGGFKSIDSSKVVSFGGVLSGGTTSTPTPGVGIYDMGDVMVGRNGVLDTTTLASTYFGGNDIYGITATHAIWGIGDLVGHRQITRRKLSDGTIDGTFYARRIIATEDDYIIGVDITPTGTSLYPSSRIMVVDANDVTNILGTQDLLMSISYALTTASSQFVVWEDPILYVLYLTSGTSSTAFLQVWD